MSKERTGLRDTLVALDCALRVHGWTLCPTCSQVMLATLRDAYRVPVALQALPVALAQASHLTPDSHGGKRVGLECGTCNRTRGPKVWHAPQGVRTVAKSDGRAYRSAAAERARAEQRRTLPLGCGGARRPRPTCHGRRSGPAEKKIDLSNLSGVPRSQLRAFLRKARDFT